MGNLDGKFSDQNPAVLSAQLITARTTVKTDLNAILTENDQIRSTNPFLIAQNVGNSNAGGGIGSAVAQTVTGTVGAAQTAGEIGSGGQPCGIATSRIELLSGWKYLRDVVIGDVVISFDPVTGDLTSGRVTDTFQHLRNGYCLLEFEDGRTTGIDKLGIHRYWTRPDYDHVANLEAVWHWNGGWTQRRIVNRRIIEGDVIVYNFTVEGHHNYLLNHDAVSNAKIQPELENPEVV